MRKFQVLAFSMIPLIAPVYAVELGPVRIDSYLNQPLSATIELNDVEAVELQDIQFSLGSLQAYGKFNLSKPTYLSPLSFKIKTGDNRSHVLHITSRRRVVEPIMNFLLQVDEPENRFLKQYTLLIDPPPVQASIAMQVENNGAKQALSQYEAAASETAAKVERPEVYAASSQTIISKDRSISIIAQNSALHPKYSVYQIMRAFYLMNTQAFEHGNIDKLISGSELLVPDESLIEEVPRQKAINFVYSVSRDNPVLATSGAQSNKAVIKTAEPHNVIQHVVHNKPKPREVSANISGLPTTTEKDLASWRSMGDEFSSLSSIVRKQNSAIKRQNSALQSIALDVENHQQKISQLSLRLDSLAALDQGAKTLTTTENGATIILNNRLDDQSSIISHQEKTILAIQEELDNKDSQIRQLESQMSSIDNETQSRLENLNPPADIRPANDMVEEVAVPQIVTNSEQASWSSRFGYLLVLIGLVVAFVIREWVWQRRFSKFQRVPKKEPTMAKPSTYAVSDKDTATKTLELNHIEPGQKSGEDKPVVTEKSSLRLHSTSMEELMVEVDVLQAYEQYSEIMQLLEKWREQFGDDPWINLKELEILAATKQCEIFMKEFELKQESLALKFPIEWVKIENLRKELCTEYKLSAVG